MGSSSGKWRCPAPQPAESQQVSLHLPLRFERQPSLCPHRRGFPGSRSLLLQGLCACSRGQVRNLGGRGAPHTAAPHTPSVRLGQATGRTAENPASPVRTGPGPTASSLPQSTGPQVMVPSFPGRETGRRAATPTVTRDRKNPDVPKPPREPPHLPRAHPARPPLSKAPSVQAGPPQVGQDSARDTWDGSHIPHS